MSRWLVGLSCLPLLVIGCKKTPPPTPHQMLVLRVTAQDRTARSERIQGLDADAMAGWIRERLRRAPDVQLDERSVQARAEHGGYRLILELGVGKRDAEDGGPSGRVVVATLRGAPASSDDAELQASTVKPLPRGSSSTADLGEVRRCVEGLLDDVLYQARLALGPSQFLVQGLGERKDVARLSAAIEIAGVRRTREAVPALIQLLQHHDEQISDRAIGALVAIGDRSAVKALTRLARLEDTERMAKLLDAIGSLGGQEARDFLEFISTGHEDADIRNLAAEALERMNRAGAVPH